MVSLWTRVRSCSIPVLRCSVVLVQRVPTISKHYICIHIQGMRGTRWTTQHTPCTSIERIPRIVGEAKGTKICVRKTRGRGASELILMDGIWSFNKVQTHGGRVKCCCSHQRRSGAILCRQSFRDCREFGP